MRKLLLLISVLTVCVIGCTTSYDAPEIPSQETKSKKYISENEAYEIALKGYKEFGFLSDSRRTKYASVRLYDNLPQSRNSSSDQDTSFYIVNFLDGGFVVVAAQREVINPIYGIAENGSFDVEDNPNLQYYMELGREYYGSNASTNGWLNPIIPPIQKADTVYSCIDSTITYVNRYVPTKWGQWSSYNYYCPPQTKASGRCPVGCVPLVVAQIMSFHRYPLSYVYGSQTYNLDWNEILMCNNIVDLENATIYGPEQVQRLLKNLGSIANVKYTDSVSYTTINYAITAFKYMGFSTSGIVKYPTIELCKSSIKEYGPIYIDGVHTQRDSIGHAWLADAYKCVKMYYNYPNGKKVYLNSYHYLDMNWGARGYGDGFYQVPTALDTLKSPNPNILYKNIRIISNITPAP